MKLYKYFLGRLRGNINVAKLKKRGLVLGENVILNPTCFIDPSHCWHISIGDDTLIAADVLIYAHDASTCKYLDYGKIGNTTIGKRVFVGARSIIMPGVTIGDDVIVGVGSVVNKDIPTNSVAIGNPAKVVCSLDLYLMIEKSLMNNENSFDESYSLRNPILSDEQKKEMKDACRKYGKAYVI